MHLRKQNAPAISDRAAVGMDLFIFNLFSEWQGKKSLLFFYFCPPPACSSRRPGLRACPCCSAKSGIAKALFYWGFPEKKKKKGQGKEEVLMPAVFQGAPTAPLSSPTTTKPQQRFAGRADDALTAAAVALPCCWSVQKPCQ